MCIWQAAARYRPTPIESQSFSAPTAAQLIIDASLLQRGYKVQPLVVTWFAQRTRRSTVHKTAQCTSANPARVRRVPGIRTRATQKKPSIVTIDNPPTSGAIFPWFFWAKVCGHLAEFPPVQKNPRGNRAQHAKNDNRQHTAVEKRA